MGHKAQRKIAVTLAGNPNVGKSTLFNALTGLHQHTGNWPGKTVGTARGSCRRKNMEFVLTDLPGTYSLQGSSREEQIAAEYLRTDPADCTVVVCDGTCLERSLILALQIIMEVSRVVVCVNLMDEAKSRGISVDRERLSQALGVPVVLTAAGKRSGLDRLIVQAEQTALSPERAAERYWEDPIRAAEQIAGECAVYPKEPKRHREQLDRLLVSRRFGVPLMFLLLLGIIWLTVWGANYPAAALEWLFDRGYTLLNGWLGFLPRWLHGLLLDGLYATCTRVIAVMLPPMAIFFPLFTLLEDVGYLPRMAFLLDPCMACCGGCGKQALTLCMGLGCNAVGVMGCRIIDSPGQRLRAILTNAMMPCNGRFPTLILLGSLFFPEAGAALVVALCVALGAAAAVATSGVLSGKDRNATFLMEMPPFRRPRLGKILVRSLLDRTLYIAGRAMKVAAPAGAVLWILSDMGMLQSISAFLEPAGRLLGMNGVFLLAFCLSLPANELLIPIVLMTLTGQTLQQAPGLNVEFLLSQNLSWQMAVCIMVFTLFHWPCSTTLMTVYRETGSIRYTLAAFALPAALGCGLCIGLNLIL